MKYLTPILVLALSGAILYWYVQPTYKAIGDLQTQKQAADKDLDTAKQAKSTLINLETKAKTFQPEDLARLQQFIPDASQNDPIQFTLNLSKIADKYGTHKAGENLIGLRNSSLDPGPGSATYSSMQTNFSVDMTYDKLKLFLKDLEQSLQLTDVVSLSFKPKDGTTDAYQCSFVIKTYFLK